MNNKRYFLIPIIVFILFIGFSLACIGNGGSPYISPSETETPEEEFTIDGEEVTEEEYRDNLEHEDGTYKEEESEFSPEFDYSDFGTEYLFLAIWEGNLSEVQRQLDHGVDPDTPYEIDKAYERPPLLEAVYKEEFEIVQMILDYGADVNRSDKYGNTALMAAIPYEPEYVIMLLDYGADVDQKNTDGYPALIIAASMGNLNSVEILLSYGADVNGRYGDYGETALMEAAAGNAYGDYVEIAQLLIDYGADVNCIRNDGWTALTVAYEVGFNEMIELLIAAGAQE